MNQPQRQHDKTNRRGAGQRKDKFDVARVMRVKKRTDYGDGVGCWLWTGASHKRSGYGKISILGKSILVHRYAYEYAHKVELTPDQLVCHTCDVRLCINPEHLFLGTNKANSEDMVRKGRQSRGEARPLAKLTADQVEAIRATYRRGRISQRQLAKDYGIGQQTISEIITGKAWKEGAQHDAR